MADEQGPWFDTNPGPKNADRRQGTVCFAGLQKAEGVCRIPRL